jgi:hypothetical protein
VLICGHVPRSLGCWVALGLGRREPCQLLSLRALRTQSSGWGWGKAFSKVSSVVSSVADAVDGQLAELSSKVRRRLAHDAAGCQRVHSRPEFAGSKPSTSPISACVRRHPPSVRCARTLSLSLSPAVTDAAVDVEAGGGHGGAGAGRAAA